MKRLSLNGLWTMNKKGSEIFYKANVPTTMYEVLLDNGVIDDPFYGENDRVLTKVSDDDYSFTKSFELEEKYLSSEVLVIEFLGIDTLASIYLNGHLVAKTNNMHRTYRFDVKQWLLAGDNTLVVALKSPTKYIAEEQSKFPLWGIETTMDGYEHLRKAHHMFGWDWGPQMPDMGIWRDVTLMAFDEGKIEDVQVIQIHESHHVTLEINTELQFLDEGLSLHYSLLDNDGKLMVESMSEANSEKDAAELVVESPKLWWPNGYGDQYLYTLRVQLLWKGTVVDENSKAIGLRTMTVHREADVWGESFDFKVNGVRIFAMGADYIPEDTCITRPSKASTERLIQDCARANYNCLRVWGGAFYPSDHFFDLCDRYGLIVWQDFMFACGVYRLTDQFQANIRAEFIDNIKRIRHHACLGLWCGNNEMEWAFVEWEMPKDERLKLDYLLMYEKLIPNVLAEYDPQTFYWPASPSSGGGFEDPNGDDKGDVHYWKIFHGNEHYKKFRDHYFRFASEYGMQALPDMKTIKSYTTESQRNIFSPVMENHNKCIEPMNGNVKILLNMAQEFQLPKQLEDQVYISQIFQGETIKCAVEHYRRNRGRCMGSTYWQLNDNYPVASWSSIDYYGRWKAMHYLAKRFYAPVLVSAYEEGTMGHIHVTNDQMTAFEGKVAWQVRHVDGRVLEQGTETIHIPPLSAKHIIDVSIASYVKAYGDERKVYLSYQLLNEVGMVASETLLFCPHKYFDFKDGEVGCDVYEEDGAYFVEVTCDVFIKSLAIQTKTLDVLFEDNFFDLLPGEIRKIEVVEQRSDGLITWETLKNDLVVQGVNLLEY